MPFDKALLRSSTKKVRLNGFFVRNFQILGCLLTALRTVQCTTYCSSDVVLVPVAPHLRSFLSTLWTLRAKNT